jgi:hypothetical protein
MKIKLSSRDTEEVMEGKYDPESFNAEYSRTFQNNFNAANLAEEMYGLGFKDESGIAAQFKDRNYPVDSETKKVIKTVIEKMEQGPK